MNTKPLIAVVEARLRWFGFIAKPAHDFKLERALCAAGALAYCAVRIYEKRYSGNSKRIKDRIQKPLLSPYVFAASFEGFPWWALEDHTIAPHLQGFLGVYEGEGLVPYPIPQADMARIIEQGFNLPADLTVVSAGNRRRRKSNRIRKFLEAA